MNFATAQEVKYDWTKVLDAKSAFPTHLDLGEDDSHYLYGLHVDSVDYDPDTPRVWRGNQSKIGFLIKLDSIGKYQWSWSITSTKSSQTFFIKEVVPSHDGNMLATGIYNDSIDLDPGPGTSYIHAPYADFFVLKFTPNGGIIWVKEFKGSGKNEGNDIQCDNLGNIYVGGFFESNCDFDPGPAAQVLSSNGEEDFFVLKLDSNGNYVWVIQIGGAKRDLLHELIVTDDGFIYTNGQYSDSADFDPGSGINMLVSKPPYNIFPEGRRSTFIQKLDLNGNLIWAKSITGGQNGLNVSSVMDLGNDNHLYWGVSATSGVVDYDPGPGSFQLNMTHFNSVIVKLTPAGDFRWARHIKADQGDVLQAITTERNSNNIVVSGQLNGVIDIDPGPDIIYRSGYGTYHVVLDTAGNYVTDVSKSGAHAISAKFDSKNKFVCSGLFFNTTDFNPNQREKDIRTPYGSSSIFIRKFEFCRVTRSDTLYWNGCGDTLPSGKPIYYSQFVFDTIQNNAGCDSIIPIDYTNNYTYSDVSFDTSCAPYISPKGNLIYNTGYYVETFLNFKANGCDSIVRFYVTVLRADTSFITATSCYQYISASGGIYNTTGFYTESLTNKFGCDSTSYLDLTINFDTYDSIYVAGCDSFITPSSKILKSSGTYLDTIQNSGGCDSIIQINLTINSPTTASITASSCYQFFSPGGNIYTNSGLYIDTINNLNGCDSIISINLTIHRRSRVTVDTTICYSYLSPSGKIYLSSGTYRDTLVNSNGCDSIITTNLTILNRSYQLIDTTACDSYISPGGKLITSSQLFFDTLINKTGCDSILEINLQILSSSEREVNVKSCLSYLSPTGKTYSESGTFIDTLTNLRGCDSIITTNLIIEREKVTNLKISACDSVLFTNNKTYKNDTTISDTLNTLGGCDSIINYQLNVIKLNPIIESVNKGFSLVSGDSLANIRWISCDNDTIEEEIFNTRLFYPVFTGTYAAELSRNSCIDTSVCLFIKAANPNLKGISIYPNPSDGFVYISLGSEKEKVTVELINRNGQLIQSFHYQNTRVIRYDLPIEAGLYLLNLKISGEETMQFKVVKK